MGQYYYRPIDPGWSALGANLATGIEQGVGNFFGQREKKRERTWQDEEDKRRREREDQEAVWRQEEADARDRDRELQLIAMGGGRGRVPGAPGLNFGTPGMALAGPTDRGREDVFGQPPRLGPEAPSAARAFMERPGRVYRPVGDDAYIEDPESRARRFAGEETRAARAAEETGQGRIASALIGMRPDLPPEKAQAASQLMGTGGFGYEDLFPEPKAPVRGTPEYEAMLGREEGVRARFDRPTGPVRGSPEDRSAQAWEARLQTAAWAAGDIGKIQADRNAGEITTEEANRQIRTVFLTSGFSGIDEIHEVLRGGEGSAVGGGAGTTAPAGGGAGGAAPAPEDREVITQDQYDWLTAPVEEGGRGMSRAEVDRLYVVGR